MSDFLLQLFAVLLVASVSKTSPNVMEPPVSASTLPMSGVTLSSCAIPEVSTLPILGRPFFMCYTRGQVAAESRNDPSFTTFNNETTNFPFPCRYLLTHLKQELKGRKRAVIGECELKIHAFNRRERGKIVTHGADISVKVTYNNGSIVERSVRKYGTAANGVNTFGINGVHAYVPDGPFTPSVDVMYADAPNKVFLKCKEDAANNQVVFEFPACGIRITFVPYDTVLRRNQEQIPGLSVGVNCAHHPVWLSNDEVIGLAPTFQGGQLLSEIVLPGLTESQSLVNRAFTNGAVQNQPDASAGCAAATTALDTCDDTSREDAYKNCFWMLLEAKFIKCVSKAMLDPAVLFSRCVDAWCNNGDCASIVTDLAVCDQVRNSLTELDDFLNGDSCPY
ncbi:hypothetical protein ElyMa_005453400 [Elysia marginata]|uniref:VWFD domain-containing protein n=1 Tax=Elysia marginata TaxID=1093978 RepID=A0AAV4EMS0_9GAST|nr:hypothetical protein ElyMa_005453400 [Elysia marginata]